MRKNAGAAAKKDNTTRKNKRKPETGVVVELDISEDDCCDHNDRQSKRQNRGCAFGADEDEEDQSKRQNRGCAFGAEDEEDHCATV